MAIIVYKCTTCNREIELVEQPRGLEVMKRCIITDKCRGTLYRTSRKQDFAVGRYPADVNGLNNWAQRNVVYTHTQTIAKIIWEIEHDLGVNPSVQVVVDRQTVEDGSIITSQIEVEPEIITIIDENNLTITFDRPETGTAQIIARSTRSTSNVEIVEAGITYLPVTTEGIMTVALDLDSNQFPDGVEEGTYLVRLYFLDQETLDETAYDSAVFSDFTAQSPVNTSAWDDTTEIFVGGDVYTVFTIDIGNPVADLEAPSAGAVLFQAGVSTIGFPHNQAPNMVVLLSNAPHANADKNRNQIFRPDLNIGPTLSLDSFIFADDEIVVDSTKVEGVFPPVYSITAPQS